MIHNYTIENRGDACVAFGKFDGMHKGHLAIINKLVEQAKKENIRSVVVSLYPDDNEKILSTEEEKEYYLSSIDLDELISYKYDNQYEVKEFVRSVLIEQLGAKIIVTGKDDNLDIILKVASENDIQVVVCDLVEEQGHSITTEDISTAFGECEFQKITSLCEHPYVMIGEVVHGKALGRTVGMPTANLRVKDNKKIPPNGVYASLTTVDGVRYKGLTNIGKRPSVDDDDRITIETFLLDFSGDIYGKQLIMEVRLFIRDVVKFDNLEQVQNQVQKDLEKTRNFLAKI